MWLLMCHFLDPDNTHMHTSTLLPTSTRRPVQRVHVSLIRVRSACVLHIAGTCVQLALHVVRLRVGAQLPSQLRYVAKCVWTP